METSNQLIPVGKAKQIIENKSVYLFKTVTGEDLIGVLEAYGPEGEFIVAGLMMLNYEYSEEHEDIATFIVPALRWSHPNSMAIIAKEEVVLRMLPRQVIVSMYSDARNVFKQRTAHLDHQHANLITPFEGNPDVQWINTTIH